MQDDRGYWVELGRGGDFGLRRAELGVGVGAVEVVGSCVHHGGEFYLRLAEQDGALLRLRKELTTYMERMGDWEALQLPPIASQSRFPRNELVAVLGGKMGKMVPQGDRVSVLGESGFMRGGQNEFWSRSNRGGTGPRRGERRHRPIPRRRSSQTTGPARILIESSSRSGFA